MSALSDALHEANVENWSARDIARRGDDRIHFATIAKYMGGRHGRPSEDVLEVFSQVLNIPMPRLRQLAGLAAGDEQPYEPPREANRLDRRQRKLVDELIRMLAETKAGDGDVDRDAAPMTPTKTSGPVIYMSAGSGKTETLAARLIAHMTSEQYDAVVVTLTDRVKKAGADLSVDEVRSIFDEIVTDAELDPGLYEDLAARPTTE